jgi:hypothetical protein
MPEYLAPGVYVEETSFRSKSIEGVSTTTTGFIGAARYGPLDLEPDVITSLGEYERIYGDRQQLSFDGVGPLHNFLWHAVRAFFEEGGKRLYVARVFKPISETNDGYARGSLPDPASPPTEAIHLQARFPGAAGNMRVRFIVRLGQNILAREGGVSKVKSLLDYEVVWIGDVTSPVSSPPGAGSFYIARFDPAAQTWNFTSPAGDLQLSQLNPDSGDTVRVATITVIAEPTDEFGFTSVWEGLALDSRHARSGSPDSLSAKFAQKPTNLAQARSLPIVLTLGDGTTTWTGLEVLEALFAAKSSLQTALNDPKSSDADRSVEVMLKGGNDGKRPEATEYEGQADETSNTKTGLKTFEDIEDISIVAAPGSTFGFENGYNADAKTIVNLLISHASRMRYRIAVLDSGDGQSIAQVRAMRAKFDSTYAALYYPWIRILDPVTRTEVHVPPSGAVAGIYARNDIIRAVYKAPANEVVNTAIGFEQLLNKGQQDVLNPEGINCFRFFEGRGFRLWGARTISSDPEWKYVNLRRYFAYLERSIDKGTQWAVFEPNGPQLWANVRRTISDFLLNEWQAGALLGDKPEQAFFVKCDRSTMTQNDLDNGRLICLIGVAPLRPAEFVIFRIGQWTADRKA